jgi:hypothetical protein
MEPAAATLQNPSAASITAAGNVGTKQEAEQVRSGVFIFSDAGLNPFIFMQLKDLDPTGAAHARPNSACLGKPRIAAGAWRIQAPSDRAILCNIVIATAAVFVIFQRSSRRRNIHNPPTPMNSGNPLRPANCRQIVLTATGMLAAAVGTACSQIAWSSDFESLDVNTPSALTDESWKAYVNVYASGGGWLYGYASTPPIGGSGFWAVTTDQAGPAQGSQGLAVYGDYYNQAAQTAGQLVEVNAFQEFVLFPEDAGRYEFRFDAKAGNLVSPSTAQAFIKVLDPGNNYATVAIASFNTSALAETWGTYSIQLALDENMDGMLLQFGFSTTSSNNIASGVFYDNLSFGIAPPEPPAITALTKSGDLVSVTFPTEAGFTYDLLKSTDGMATFNPVISQPVITGDGTSKVATDNAATEPSAFYRIRRQP